MDEKKEKLAEILKILTNAKIGGWKYNTNMDTFLSDSWIFQGLEVVSDQWKQELTKGDVKDGVIWLQRLGDSGEA